MGQVLHGSATTTEAAERKVAERLLSTIGPKSDYSQQFVDVSAGVTPSKEDPTNSTASFDVFSPRARIVSCSVERV
ncbi:hypothetical protein GGE56_005849 [Rhizobium leguminosarum]|nr:hypothetical protein [Rhizobium leguminosarum]MBB6297523.1 hypothetical protein [Rhizobium leguminosarum]